MCLYTCWALINLIKILIYLICTSNSHIPTPPKINDNEYRYNDFQTNKQKNINAYLFKTIFLAPLLSQMRSRNAFPPANKLYLSNDLYIHYM